MLYTADLVRYSANLCGLPGLVQIEVSTPSSLDLSLDLASIWTPPFKDLKPPVLTV